MKSQKATQHNAKKGREKRKAQKNKKGEVVHTGFQCLEEVLPPDWRVGDVRHATPLQRVTFCERGGCVVGRNNTVLLGVVEYNLGRTHSRYVSSLFPLEYPSVLFYKYYKMR